MTLSRAVLQKGCLVPRHAHPSEQATYVLEGALQFRLGDDGAEAIDVRAGEVVVIPANVPHEVLVVDTALLFDIFSPSRQDWAEGRDVAFSGQR
jgi:quercetin dioxygenase-like cupin family protein